MSCCEIELSRREVISNDDAKEKGNSHVANLVSLSLCYTLLNQHSLRNKKRSQVSCSLRRSQVECSTAYNINGFNYVSMILIAWILTVAQVVIPIVAQCNTCNCFSGNSCEGKDFCTWNGTHCLLLTTPQPTLVLDVITLAGSGSCGFLDAVGTSALFNDPANMCEDPNGDEIQKVTVSQQRNREEN